MEEKLSETNSKTTFQNTAVILALPAPSAAAPESTLLHVTTTPTHTTPIEVTEGSYVASKSGTKYHLPWCGGAQRIKEENKVWFKTKEDAEKAGYTPAANCKGI